MGRYRIFMVSRGRAQPGKITEAAKWWNDKGRALFEASPGTKSVSAYAVQFGLGGDYGLEIWSEIEDYAAFDRLDEDLAAHPEKYAAWAEVSDIIEWGPARLMGDWPESHFPLGDD